MMKSVIIGIDPGSRVTGYGVIASAESALRYLGSGCVYAGDGDFTARLHTIFTSVGALIKNFEAGVMAIEETFLAKNVQSTVKLSEARASAIVAAAEAGLPVFEYTPRQIKQAVTGTGRADKRQVQYMVKEMLDLAGTLQADAGDALACAICHAYTYNVTAAMGGQVAKAYSVRGRLRGTTAAGDGH